MALISKESKNQKSEVRVKIPGDVKEAIEAYCQWADIKDIGHFFAEAAKLVFAKDREWQKASKSQVLLNKAG